MRYPGGKSRALRFLDQHLPAAVDEFREPFCGGCSVAFHIAARNPAASVWINDAFAPVVAFWRVVQDAPAAQELHARIAETKAGDLRASNLAAREVIKASTNELELAAAFYVLNKTAFSGVLGTFSQDIATRWLRQSDDRLLTTGPLMAGWRITNYDYNLVMRAPWTGRHPLLFLDPPYAIEEDRLYGVRGKGGMHKGFDHGAFHAAVHAATVPTMVTYNAGFEAEYAAYPTCLVWDHTYSMQSGADYKTKQSARRELLVCNFPTQSPALMAAE